MAPTRDREEMLRAPETAQLIAADKVAGTPVFNADGDELGPIERIMIDKITGKVAYAVMSFGGFLGIGDRHHPLPWNVLHYDTRTGGYVVDLDKQTLERAPTILASDDRFNWDDAEWNRKVHNYYKTPLY